MATTADRTAQVIEVTMFQIECPTCGWEQADWEPYRDQAEHIAAQHRCPPGPGTDERI